MRPRARIHWRVRFVSISEESPVDGGELWLADAGSGRRVGTVFDKFDWLLEPKIGDKAASGSWNRKHTHCSRSQSSDSQTARTLPPHSTPSPP